MYPSNSGPGPGPGPGPAPAYGSRSQPASYTPLHSTNVHRLEQSSARLFASDLDSDPDADADTGSTAKLLPPPDYYGTIPAPPSSDHAGLVVSHHHYHHYAPPALAPHSPTSASFYLAPPPPPPPPPLADPTGCVAVTATLAALAKRTLMCFTRAVAICCCFALLTVLLAALTAGSMVHFAPGRLPGLSGDPASTVVDGIEWPCASSGLDPLRALRGQWTVPAESLFVNVSGVASGAVRYAGFDVDPDVYAMRGGGGGPGGAKVVVDVSVHVSHEHLIPAVAAHGDPTAGVVTVATPESKDMSRIFRECVIASVNISMVPSSYRHFSSSSPTGPVALKALKVRTINLHHYLSSMTLRRRSPGPASPSTTSALPSGWTGLDDLALATTNGHIQLTPSGPWSIHSSLSLATTNGNIDLAGPLRFAGTSLAAESTNGNLHLRAMLRPATLASGAAARVTASTTNGNIDLAIADLVPGARVAAAATNGNVQVTAGPDPDLVGAKLRAATALGSAQAASRAAGWPRRTVKGNGWMGGVAELVVRRIGEGTDGEVAEVAEGQEADEDEETDQVMGISSGAHKAWQGETGQLGDDEGLAHVRASSTTGNAVVAMDDLLLVRVVRK